jgi:hypothetical protein
MLKNCLYILLIAVFIVMVKGAAYANGHGGGHESGPHFGNVVIFLGVLTFFCMLSTFVLGFLMPKKRKTLFPWHKRMGIVTLISAILHGTVVLVFH